MSDARLRLVLDYAFGIVLNLGIILMARGIGVGQVEEKTSYGLGPIISMLGAVDVLWAQGMWGNRRQTAELEKKA